MPNPIPFPCPACSGQTIITPNGNRHTPEGYRRCRTCKDCGHNFYTVAPEGEQEVIAGPARKVGYQVTRAQLPVRVKRQPSLKALWREVVRGIKFDVDVLGYVTEATRDKERRYMEAKRGESGDLSGAASGQRVDEVEIG